VLAITDHDTVKGYEQALVYANLESITLIPGVELSCVWGKQGIHVVGLNIDINSSELSNGINTLQQARSERAHIISDKLSRLGFKGGYDYAKEVAAGGQIGRPHFAQFLVEKGHVPNVNTAFKRYLGAGKPGDVKTVWPALKEVVGWIVDSGGVAVLAHPLHYKMTATRLRALITDFKTAGGTAIEVISGSQQLQQTEHLAQLATRYQLMASVGSDFHRPDFAWSELGKVGKLPAHCQPVWQSW